MDLAVRVASRPYSVRAARLVNLSLSGAYIRVATDLRPLSRVQVAIALSHRLAQPAPVAAYVARKCKDGIAVEWCDHAPKLVLELLRHAALHPREHCGAARYQPASDERQSVAEA